MTPAKFTEERQGTLPFLACTTSEFRFFLGAYGVLLISVGLFALSKRFLLYPSDLQLLFPEFAGALLLAAAGWQCHISHLDRSLALLVRGLALFIGLYLATAWPSFEIPNGQGSASAEWFFEYGRWTAVAAAVVAFTRPTFILVPMFYLVLFKHGATLITGIRISQTDYMPIAEIGIFIAFSLLLFTWLERNRVWQKIVTSGQPDGWSTSVLLFMMVLALHFGNYLWSGIEKLLLDGGPATWLLENKTQYMILVARSAGMYPLSHWPDLAAWVYEITDTNGFAINFLTLATQLFSIIALGRIRWALWLTVFYDLVHISIFLLTGIFFWKWILLNLALVAALATLVNLRIPKMVGVVSIVIILLSQWVFFTARLGWYDTRAYNHVYLIANTADNAYAVPTNFFLTNSITFAQERIGRPFVGHFPTLTYASTIDYETMKKANGCRLEPTGLATIPPASYSKHPVEIVVRKHHQFMLANTDSTGRVEYDFYPHHMFSNPMEFQQFSDLDLRKIVSYDFVVESVCLGFSENRFTENAVYQSRRSIDVR